MPHFDWEENENMWDEYAIFGRAVKLNLKDLNRKHEYELDCILRSWEKERPYAMQKIDKNPFSPFRYAVYNNTIEVPIREQQQSPKMKTSTISEVKKSKSFIKRPKLDKETDLRDKNISDAVLDRLRKYEPTNY